MTQSCLAVVFAVLNKNTFKLFLIFVFLDVYSSTLFVFAKSNIGRNVHHRVGNSARCSTSVHTNNLKQTTSLQTQPHCHSVIFIILLEGQKSGAVP